MHAQTICIGTYGLNEWFDGDFRPVVDLIALADQLGIDQINVPDHVVMGEATDKYPYGKFVTPPDYPWVEPLALLSAAAQATRKIRLSTGIIIAPLRPAALLAKQVATLDMLSGGRVDLGVGVGWQKEEYLACGFPFEARFALLDEEMRACRMLWSQAPASFAAHSSISTESTVNPSRFSRGCRYFSGSPLRPRMSRASPNTGTAGCPARND